MLILCRFALPDLSTWESGNIVSLIIWSMAVRAWYFWDIFTCSNYFSYFSVKYLGSSSITDGITMSCSFSPEFMMSG